MNRKARLVFAILSILLLGSCVHQSPSETTTEPPITATEDQSAAPEIDEIDLESIRPNELGEVMILQYHDIGPNEARWVRTPENFRKDLQRLYDLGYRPISLRDYVTNNINTEPGKTPVVITFDDSTEGQFRILPDGSIDPDCAFAILKDFNRKHPDFPLRATFYVIYPTPFRQREHVSRKFREIIDAGMDIGNHTYSHDSLRRLSSEGAMKELALAVREAKRIEPRAIVDSIALPYGLAPKDRSVLKAGKFEDMSYTNIAALLVGANPAPSPVSPDFDPFRLPRIQAVDPSIATFGIDQWIRYFERNPDKRYLSDGDPNIVTVREAMAHSVDQEKLGGKKLRTY